MANTCSYYNLMWAVDQKLDNHLEWPYCTKSFHNRASCLLVPTTQFKRNETITSTYTFNNVSAHVQQQLSNTMPKIN